MPEAFRAQPPLPGTRDLERAAGTLRRGAVLAYPTEAVYGLGCDPRTEAAVRRILSLKGRPQEQGLILIGASLDQLEPFLAPMEAVIRRRVMETWPGPVTWLLRARREVPALLRGAHETVAVRVTAHPVAAELCRRAGMAIVSTSANPSGRPPARSVQAARAYFRDQVAGYLEGPVDPAAAPTEIRDPYTGTLYRAGGGAQEDL